MTDKNIIRGMERFINSPREAGAPFDPFIVTQDVDGLYTVSLMRFRTDRARRSGMKPLPEFQAINALGQRHKYSCASKPNAMGGRLWMFSDFNIGTVLLKDSLGADVTKGRMKPYWYRCMTDLWERKVRLPSQNWHRT